MATALTTRITAGTGATVKNAPLTSTEIDNNFLSLNDNKLETTWTGSTSVVTLGTISTGTWSATTIATTKGGTGLTSFTANGAVYASSTSALTTGTLPVASGGTGVTSVSSGQVLIGNSGGGFTAAGLTGTSNRISVSAASGSITLSTPQDIATSSNVQFNSIGVGTAANGTAGRIDMTSIYTTSISSSTGSFSSTLASGTHTVTGSITATGDITGYYSDDNLKNKLGTIDNALEKLMTLTGFYYEANETAQALGYEVRREVGVSAQQVQAVLPEVVAPAPIEIGRAHV